MIIIWKKTQSINVLSVKLNTTIPHKIYSSKNDRIVAYILSHLVILNCALTFHYYYFHYASHVYSQIYLLIHLIIWAFHKNVFVVSSCWYIRLSHRVILLGCVQILSIKRYHLFSQIILKLLYTNWHFSFLLNLFLDALQNQCSFARYFLVQYWLPDLNLLPYIYFAPCYALIYLVCVFVLSNSILLRFLDLS